MCVWGGTAGEATRRPPWRAAHLLKIYRLRASARLFPAGAARPGRGGGRASAPHRRTETRRAGQTPPSAPHGPKAFLCEQPLASADSGDGVTTPLRRHARGDDDRGVRDGRSRTWASSCAGLTVGRRADVSAPRGPSDPADPGLLGLGPAGLWLATA